jgi:hypothetical protein
VAEIIPEIIDPSGFDLPTTVYDTPEAAIDLLSHPMEIRGYIYCKPPQLGCWQPFQNTGLFIA